MLFIAREGIATYTRLPHSQKTDFLLSMSKHSTLTISQYSKITFFPQKHQFSREHGTY